jgi:hypothetical protein
MRAKCVSDFYEPVDCEIQAMTTAIQRGDRGVQLDADFSPGIEIIEGWSVPTEPDIRGALPALQKYARALTRSPIAQLRPCYRQADFERGHAIHGHKKWI